MSPQYKRGRFYDAYRGGKKLKPKVAPVVKKYVKRCMDRVIEDKFWQSAVATVNNTSAGVVTQLELPSIRRGTTSVTRIGNFIRPKFLEIRGTVEADTTRTNYGRFRVLVVVDMQCNGAAATASDVLGQVHPLGPYNPLYVQGCGGKRFKIIKDRTFSFNPYPYYNGVASVTAGMAHTFKWRFRCPSLPAVVGYDADTGTITDLMDRNVFMILVSDDNDYALNYNTWWCYQDA